MAIRVVRLGTPRQRGEGPRLGTVRRPPRGVRKADITRRGFYDVWLPELAPSQKWVSFALKQPWSLAKWRRFEAAYRREMAQPAAGRLLDFLALVSKQPNFAVGWYCEDASRCHRSILGALLRERGASVRRGA